MSSLKDRLAQAEAAAVAPAAGLAPVFGENRAGQRLAKLPLDQLIPWSDANNKRQPFRPYTEAQMLDMMESMAANGLHQPIIARPYGGRYQILAGHNRVTSARQLGWSELDAVIRFDLEGDDAKAARVMVETNFNQREVILPSERAKAYRILLDENNHQGKKMGARTDAMIGANEKMGRSSIQRYAKLARLCDDLLDIVDGFQYDSVGEWVLLPDKRKIPLSAADKLTDLTLGDQMYLVSLFQKRTISSITVGNAIELDTARQAFPPNVDLSQELLHRCLGLTSPRVSGLKEKKQHTVAVKFSREVLPPHTPKAILSNPELQRRVAQVVAQFILEQKEGADV